MLKDIFFNIWYDDMGSGWLLFVIILLFFYLAILIFLFARLKAQNKSFSKKHLIHLGLFALIFYQIIPISIDFGANVLSEINIKKAINLKQVAIKTSIIPWQKGGYLCNLAILHLIGKDYNEMYKTYNTAYKYLKSYKYPCWGASYLSFYTKGDYDISLEIAKNLKGSSIPYQFISNCYLMKNDLKNAELYINKDIEHKETYLNYASKAYILKRGGDQSEAIIYYKKALRLCKNQKEKNIAKNIYNDFVKYEKNRLDLLRKKQGLNLEIQ